MNTILLILGTAAVTHTASYAWKDDEHDSNTPVYTWPLFVGGLCFIGLGVFL